MKRKKVTKKVEPNKKSSEEKNAAETGQEKVFDITNPGKSMPSASSRPLIVTHKPDVTDPMVSSKKNEETPDDAETADKPLAGESTEMVMAAPKKGRIEPLHTDVVPDDTHAEIPDGQESKSDDVESDEDKPEPAVESENLSEPEEDTQSDEISDMAAEATTKKQAQSEFAQKEAEATKKQAEVEALVNNKQFFVPINAVQKRRSTKLLLVLVVLLIALFGVLAAWDAEIINIGIDSPIDIL